MTAILRRVAPALVALLAALGLLVVTAVPAQARTLSLYKVGEVMGEYTVAPKNYDGHYYPARVNQCVKVQRKAGGEWRDNVTSAAPNYGHCSEGSEMLWRIHDDTLALNTTAIRIIVVSGDYLGSYIVLCSDTDDCRGT